jgi:uncharacterized membrane protein
VTVEFREKGARTEVVLVHDNFAGPGPVDMYDEGAQGVEGPGGRRIAADIEITELTPGETIAFHTVAGPVRPRGRYVLSDADGGTRVRFELEADMRSFKRLIAQMVQKTMNNEVGQLPRLKDVIEAR